LSCRWFSGLRALEALTAAAEWMFALRVAAERVRRCTLDGGGGDAAPKYSFPARCWGAGGVSHRCERAGDSLARVGEAVCRRVHVPVVAHGGPPHCLESRLRTCEASDCAGRAEHHFGVGISLCVCVLLCVPRRHVSWHAAHHRAAISRACRGQPLLLGQCAGPAPQAPQPRRVCVEVYVFLDECTHNAVISLRQAATSVVW